ncbi:MAG: hypothetical protein JXR66_04130 [Bacteroidales bacterium]|nr:hypothetical protein [Bacteroidales bacterium]MBN2632721.1 hypothetical protein [Bacteroidales bacterium]
MKKSVFNRSTILGTALFLLSLGISAQQEVSKEYSKEYTAGENTELELSNRYGDVTIRTSDDNKVVINVKVMVRYPNREKAERLLSYIDVEFTESPELIKAQTVIDDKFSFNGWGGDSRKFRIDYNVTMPENMSLELYNRYGNTELDDLSGYVDVDIKYGNLNAGRLTRGAEKPRNRISLAYGKASVDEAGWLDVYLRYCGDFNLPEAQALLLDSKYSHITLGTVNSLVADSRYDSNFRIDNINNLVIDQGYSNVDIGSLSKKLMLTAGYGSFSSDRVADDFESLEIDTRYASVTLGIDESADYSLDAKLSYGGIRFNDENFNVKRRIVENTSTELVGTVGDDESPESSVKIRSSYATIKLYR